MEACEGTLCRDISLPLSLFCGVDLFDWLLESSFNDLTDWFPGVLGSDGVL